MKTTSHDRRHTWPRSIWHDERFAVRRRGRRPFGFIAAVSLLGLAFGLREGRGCGWPQITRARMAQRLFLTAIFSISLVAGAACRAPHRRDAGQPPGSDANARERAAAAIVPLIDYHRHLRSPAAAEREAQTPLPTVELPQDLARLLIDRTERWNNAAGLAQLYTEHSTLLDPTGPRWLRGRLDVSARMASFFRAAYRDTPIAWSVH